MPDDWRLRFEFAAADEAERFETEARAVLPPTSEVSRADRIVFVYPDAESDARDAERRLTQLDLSALPRRQSAERWNPGRLEWQDPALPIEEPFPRVDVSLLDLHGCDWIVEVDAMGVDPLREWQELWRAGVLVVPQGRTRKAFMSASDEQAAQRACERIEATGAAVRTRARRLSRFRRWRLAQRFHGNYDSGAYYWHNQPGGRWHEG